MDKRDIKLSKNLLHRRELLLGVAACITITPYHSNAQTPLNLGELRGIVDASKNGLSPQSVKDQSSSLQNLINKTASKQEILFIPAGNYYVSNIELPDNTRILGIANASRIIYTGRGHGMRARSAQHIELRDIVLDGASNVFSNYAKGLLHISNCPGLLLDNIIVRNSAFYGIYLESCGGSIKNCDISHVREAAIYAVQNTGLNVRNNHIHDCDNGGILIHRWEVGEDNTSVSNNRIARIAAMNGGTGPWGNGINVFRAGNVSISDNHISDCAFSAIRANSASNIRISDNSCFGSGETALYVEFAFQGAVVTGNLIDGGTIGISIANFDSGGRMSVISGNLVRNIIDKGPYPPEGPGFGHGIAVEADASVTGNTIENVAKWGMLLGWGPFLRSVNINGNVIRKAPIGIAVSVVKGAKSTSITNNIFDEISHGAIMGHEWSKPVTSDLALSTKSRFSHLRIVDNIVN
jgi:uncharacterized secreted repeat protein (TIGR03808 family)